VRLFPPPEIIAESRLDFLKTTGARKNTLRAFAAAVANGTISLEPTQDVAEFEASVRRIKGIGAWSASYMSLKVLRHADAFPATDLILARALALHPPAALERVRPWRGYAAALFWREYSQTLKKRG
jgi:AraC family transcriptional regulator of adaptative response / DNA-3-methyladenine glycosylase II